jgi:hypothetical protein
MTTMGQRVRGWARTFGAKQKTVEQQRPAERSEAPAAPDRRSPGHSPIRVKIDPEAWHAMAPPAGRHDSGIHRPSAIGARSEIHSGKWEGLDPFGGKEKR